MRVEVIGSPELCLDGKQVIHVSHTEATDITTILCNADLVTVGIAAHTLKKKFDEVASSLSPTDLEMLTLAVERAVE